MSTPTYMYSADAENGRVYSEFENPFAFSNEMNGNDNNNRGSGPILPAKTSSRTSSGSWYRHRWNTFLKIITIMTTLAAIILLAIFANQEIPNTDTRVQYKNYSSFVFLLAANVIACSYATLLTVIACVMGRMEKGSTPASVFSPVVFINVIVASLLVVACAAALAVELLNRNGTTLYINGDRRYINWAPVCSSLKIGSFCTVIEAALAFSFFGYLTMMASTCFDAYDIYKVR